MADWPPVIDADGHVLERQSDIRKYLEPPWNRRNTGLWPSDQPFDTDLFDTLGYPGYGRNMSPAQQVQTWLKIMDEYNIEQAVLFPTGSGNIPKLREPEFCLAACRAANDHFAKEYNALSERIHCVGVLPLKWPQEAAKELRRAVTELGLVSFELLSMGLPTALGDPMYDPLYEEAQRLDVPLSVHGNRSSSAEVGAGALRTFAEVHTYTFPVGIFLHFTSIIFQGVPVRFPKLRLAFLEIGANPESTSVSNPRSGSYRRPSSTSAIITFSTRRTFPTGTASFPKTSNTCGTIPIFHGRPKRRSPITTARNISD